MGNILGKQRVFYISYDPSSSSSSPSSSSSTTSSEEEDDDDGEGVEVYYTSYGWPQDMFWFPHQGNYGQWGWGWEGAVVGVARRKGCTNRDHWALAFRSNVDVSRLHLPRRINGVRTQIPNRCRETCGRHRRRHGKKRKKSTRVCITVREASQEGDGREVVEVLVGQEGEGEVVVEVPEEGGVEEAEVGNGDGDGDGEEVVVEVG
ncbi:uncharacterized protein GGS25DRAFT_524406 [Hypoxylon fragiforme]|uniref:uncharacterized protein n=1 Tax=Hypoxylon fragiforme TaxID=63214 RepID=UPI0020C722FD|nr:uncharacterized protein GGS25DRAFT_524406 [Hypoxylon fragiforme]KAI2604911.1 hypothetical protein GGS25DRAFT_524406 [Hypoxylon fragiforme]